MIITILTLQVQQWRRRMGSFGNIGPWEEKEEAWESYTERMEQYLQANGVTDGDKRKAVLLSTVGSKTFMLLRNLLAPAKPSDKSYQDIVDALTHNYNPLTHSKHQSINVDRKGREERDQEFAPYCMLCFAVAAANLTPSHCLVLYILSRSSDSCFLKILLSHPFLVARGCNIIQMLAVHPQLINEPCVISAYLKT